MGRMHEDSVHLLTVMVASPLEIQIEGGAPPLDASTLKPGNWQRMPPPPSGRRMRWDGERRRHYRRHIASLFSIGVRCLHRLKEVHVAPLSIFSIVCNTKSGIT
jgi:hypothetical protein